MIKKVAILCALLAAGSVLAEDAPQTEPQPIYIESDSLDIDDTKGISIYRGNVRFRQGSASLSADVVKVYAKQRQDVEKIIAEGKPARFEQKAEKEGEQDSSGEANLIEYHAAESLVVLDGNARFQQGENVFAGNRVEYQSDTKVVRAGKSVADEGRVQIVIQPRNGDGQKESAQ